MEKQIPTLIGRNPLRLGMIGQPNRTFHLLAHSRSWHKSATS
jgi:hypothetical protein